MLKITNTLSQRKEVLKPAKGKKLNLFVCGITPYDMPHIGNARTYVVFDAFVKFLRARGFQVTYLQNVTDIDDKIILKARLEGKSAAAVARKFEKLYYQNMKALSVTSVDRYERATDHIPEIISQVQRLLEKGFAYEIEGDGVYFNISTFKGYGKLSHRTTLQAEDAVSRIDESVKKRNKGDFALWKVSKKGEPHWKSPWGKGRPGWHIEDTAITEKHFGVQYDIHGGAKDLLFPHHEAEIAQMEAISGKSPLATYWMHPGFLTVKGKKMSKSLGNFVTIEDFLNQHSPRLFRLLALKTHYRSPINYSDKLIAQTERELQRFDEFVASLKSQKGTVSFSIGRFRARFIVALEDDFNTPKALAALFDLMGFYKKAMPLSSASRQEVLAFLKEANAILGFLTFQAPKKQVIPQTVQNLVEKREGLRIKREWGKADAIRGILEQKGWIVEDGPNGPRVKKA